MTIPDTVLQAVREVTGCGKEVSGVFRSLPMIATNPVVMPTCYQQVLHSDSPALDHPDCDKCLSRVVEAVIRQAMERSGLVAIRQRLPEKISQSWLYDAIRHYQRNCEYEPPRDGEELGRYDGETIYRLIAAIDALLPLSGEPTNGK